MLARVVLCLSVLLLSCCLTSAVNNSMIFQDYTSGLRFVIISNSMLNNPSDSDANYNTLSQTYTLPGSNTPHPFTGPILFALDWANDTSDVYTIAVGATLPITIAAYGPQAQACGGTSNSFFVTLSASLPQCQYSITINSPFTGVFSLTYNGVSVNDEVQQISIPFSNTSSVVGDPQFIGLRGQSYQVHGIDGAVYNIISEQSTQVNARFVFLTQGSCPMFNGVPDTNCWSHPGSYLGELSFQQEVNGKLHAALVVAGPAKKGFSMVQVDGKTLSVGQSASYGSFSVSVRTAWTVEVTTENFAFELSNSDMFVNQALRSTVPLSQLQSHGLLGQTHSAETYPTALRYIAGSVDDYAVADNDIFGSSFVYNQFQPQQQ